MSVCKVVVILGLILSVQSRLCAQVRYVQSANGGSSTSVSGVSASFSSNTTAGDTIIVTVSTVGPAISSVVDTQGNVYAQAVTVTGSAIWYATNIKAGADTVTANFAASSLGLIYIHEYSGLATNPLDQVSTQTGTGTAVTSGAKTTTQANELIFGYASVNHCAVGGGTGFTVRQTAGCNMSEDMIVSSTGTYSATFTQNVSSGWEGLMATFKAAAAPSGINYVQSANGGSSTSVSGVSASFSSNTTAGDTIIVTVSTVGPAISSVVDTQGNVYAQAVTVTGSAIWYATNIKTGADTVTANFAASSLGLIYIHEYSGLATNPLDQVSTQTGTGTAVTSGAKTTTQANELIFGYASVNHCAVGGGTGFTVRQTAGCNMSEDMIVSSTGTYSATFTQNVSSGWEGLMATFAAAGTAPPPCTTPTAPTNVAAIAVSSSEIDLTWNASTSSCSGITYTVFRSTSSGSTGSQIASGVAATSYHDTSVSAGTTYYYQVEGTNAGGTSGLSNQASATSLTSCTTPTAPTNVAATAVSSSEIDLTWNASTSSCSGITYIVFRSTSSGSTGSQITSGVAATSYHDTTVSAGTTYYYEVEGTNAGGTSGLSNQASATSLTSPPPTTSSIAIDTGSTAAVGAFAADEYFAGGTMYSTSNTINISKVPDPAPAGVYQTHRYGTFTYVMPGLTPGANYLVRLHFARFIGALWPVEAWARAFST